MCTDVLLDTLSACEQWPLLVRYFDASRAAGAAPSAKAYERAVEACDRIDPDRALVLFDEMRSSGV